MKIKLLNLVPFILIFVPFLFFAQPTHGQTLTTCAEDTKPYYDKSTRACHLKSGCKPDPTATARCIQRSPNGRCDLQKEKVCICNYPQVECPADLQSAADRQDTSWEGVFGKIDPPDAVKNLGPGGAESISNFLSNLVILIYIIASVTVVFMVVWGAFEWIISGGDKEKVGNARKRITFALVGLVLLSLSFVILRVMSSITGIELFRGAGLLNTLDIDNQQYRDTIDRENQDREERRFINGVEDPFQ